MGAAADKRGEGTALAFCIGGAFLGAVLLPTTRLLDLKGAAALALAAVLAAGLGLALRTGAGRGRLGLPPWSLHLCWSSAFAALFFSWAASPYRTLVPDMAMEDAYPAGLCVALILAAGPRRWGDTLLCVWPWATLALAAYALAQRLGLEPMAAYALAGSRSRAMASFGNPGYLAAYLCLSWPMLLAWARPRRTAALALVLAALVATQSRAALLAVAAQAAVAAGLALKRGRPAGPGTGFARRGLAAFAVGAAGLAAVSALLFPFSQWMRPTERLALWKAAFQLWLERPWLGWGPGSFAFAFQERAPAPLRALVESGGQYAGDPHQLLLAVACACGLLGLAALALALGLFIREVRRSPSSLAPALGLGALGLLLESQADRFFFLPGVFVPLCAAFGILARRERIQPERPTAPRRVAWIFFSLAALFAWQSVAPILRYHDAVGASMDEGVRSLAAPGSLGDRRAQAAGSLDPAVFDRLGDALAAEKRYSEAAQAFARALTLEATSGRAQNLGNCFMMLGDAAKAEAAFRRAVALGPGSSDAHFSLGYALFCRKRLRESVQELDAALRLDPDNARASQLRRQILQ